MPVLWGETARGFTSKKFKGDQGLAFRGKLGPAPPPSHFKLRWRIAPCGLGAKKGWGWLNQAGE